MSSSRVAGWTETLEADIDRILEIHERVISGLAELIESIGKNPRSNASHTHVGNSEDGAMGCPDQEIAKRRAV